MKNLTTRVPNYMQIYFPYSTVTSAFQWSGLAWTRTNYLRTLMYMQKHFHHKNKPFYRNEINTVNQLQLNYFTNIHLLIPPFINMLCVWWLLQNDDGWGIGLRMWKPGRGRINDFDQFEQRVACNIMDFFPVDPDNPVLMESQCTAVYTTLLWKVCALCIFWLSLTLHCS